MTDEHELAKMRQFWAERFPELPFDDEAIEAMQHHLISYATFSLSYEMRSCLTVALEPLFRLVERWKA